MRALALDLDAFLTITQPALHSDEGPPFATDPRLQGAREFVLIGFVAILVRDN